MPDYTPKKVADEGDEITSRTVHVRKSIWKELKKYVADKEIAIGEVAGQAIEEWLERRREGTKHEKTTDQGLLDPRKTGTRNR